MCESSLHTLYFLSAPIYIFYLHMLQASIVTVIREIFGDEVFYLQQDGAPPHYHRYVRAYLDDTVLGRWIGRRGAIEYPPRSPDLTPLDFYLWTMG